MKKLISVLIFIFAFSFRALALPAISDDFYLNNRTVLADGETAVSNVLPNTLRLEICEGESSKLFADIMPEDATETRLQWKIKNNSKVINLVPEGRECMVYGVSEGVENIEIKSTNGVKAKVEVKVKKKEEPCMSGFVYEEHNIQKSNVKKNGGIRQVSRNLAIAAAVLFAFAGFLILRDKRGNDNEN